MDIDKYRRKKILIVGLGKTGFSLIHLFNKYECDIKVTDIKPIFDLNKQVKRLKRISPVPQMTLGEHKNEDFLEADLIIYSPSVDVNLAQLKLAREYGKEVFSEFGFAYQMCDKPIIAVCGSYGRTSIANMVGYTLRMDGKKIFVGGTSDQPFINFITDPQKAELDYVIVEASAIQLQSVDKFEPVMAIFPNLDERSAHKNFQTITDYMESALKVVKYLKPDQHLIVNFDKLSSNSILRACDATAYWYSRKSFVKMGVIHEVQGTHFHEKRIHSNVNYHSEFKVNKMRIVGVANRENILAAITACKALNVSDESIQKCIEQFPGIPHRLEFVIEKNGVTFYNDSKSETMADLKKSLEAFKKPVILISGGKDTEQEFEPYFDILEEKSRLMVLVGESKESMNRSIGHATQTFLVGSFDESVLIAYQKSRTGDVILLCPGNDSTDIFRDYEEKGNYFKKLIFQL
jgi:UDP-N-acetylmuramoylalanine--D-glutamate ligase